jgi:hypothetical protein
MVTNATASTQQHPAGPPAQRHSELPLFRQQTEPPNPILTRPRIHAEQALASCY